MIEPFSEEQVAGGVISYLGPARIGSIGERIGTNNTAAGCTRTMKTIPACAEG
jgi:hypothetical protein